MILLKTETTKHRENDNDDREIIYKEAKLGQST